MSRQTTNRFGALASDSDDSSSESTTTSSYDTPRRISSPMPDEEMANQACRDTTGTPSGSGTRQPIPQTEPTPAPPTRPNLTTLTSNDWCILIETMKENNRGLIEELAPVLIQPRGDPIPKSSLAKPREFTGALSEYEAFRDEVLLYITGNPRELDMLLKRILFTLSYLKSGQAEVWRCNWQCQRMNL